MKWVILGMLLASGVLFVIAELADKSGRSADEKIAAAIYGVPAILLFVGAIVLALGWAVFKALFS